MEIAGVVRLERVIVIGPVIGEGQFIARVQDRDAALGQQEGVERFDGAHHMGDPFLFAALERGFEA